MIDNLKKELIALEVIQVLYSLFDRVPSYSSDIAISSFHSTFFKAFSDSNFKKGWLSELDCYLEQIFFQNIACILSDGERREFTKLTISQFQHTNISDIMAQLQNMTLKPNLSAENTRIFPINGALEKDISNFTADVFFDDGSQIVAIELKTVKPNSGIFQGEKDKILRAKAALKNKYPNKDVKYFIGFPFDPSSNYSTHFDKNVFMDYAVDFRKYFDPEEVLLSSELWDYLSGVSNTMEMILEIINTIATPDFMDNFQLINDTDNFLDKQMQLLEILERWYLFREKQLVENYAYLSRQTQNQQGMKRILQQAAFNNKGEYKNARYEQLNSLLISIPDKPLTLFC